MPIELTWLLPDKILLSRWTGEVSEDDMRVVIEETRIILEAANGLIHTVVELVDVNHISTDGVYLFIESNIPKHPNHGRICVVNPTFESEVLADMTNRVFQLDMLRLFDSQEEARDFLLAHDNPPPALDTNRLPSCQAGMAVPPPEKPGAPE